MHEIANFDYFNKKELINNLLILNNNYILIINII